MDSLNGSKSLLIRWFDAGFKGRSVEACEGNSTFHCILTDKRNAIDFLCQRF